MEPDFSGWATKANIKCSDGRVITPDAFRHQDKMRVPLVWQHGHNDPELVLGYAILEHRAGEGIYAYGYFNETAKGKASKELLQHGDLKHLSIFANQLKETVVSGIKQVIHGMVREVSLVLAGANPGALIDFVALQHGDGVEEILDDAAIIHTGLELEHEDPAASEDGLTVQDVYDAMSEEEKAVVHLLVDEARKTVAHTAEDKSDKSTEDKSKENTPEDELAHQDKEGTTLVHQNVFEMNGQTITGKDGKALTHDQMSTLAHSVFETYQKGNSFHDALLAHAGDYGINDIELLFPDAKALTTAPEWLTRKMAWVETVMNGTRKVPFSRIKSLSADLTLDTARAKGFVKGGIKKEQFFALAKRVTTPFTIYKKQKLDRDDITDITDFDVVAWLWGEMYFMLREESARAILVGDGREIDDEDKISEENIRPIALDDPFYTDVVTVPAGVGAQDLVEAVLRARKNYLGTGQPTAFMTTDVYTDMVLAKDGMRRRLYRNKAELAAELNVSDIVEVPVMEGLERDGGEVLMILVNLSDYAVGATQGGEITKFDQFDIDRNQQKYLIEGRFSGALTKHKTAQVIVRAGGTEVTPAVPTFNAGTGVVTIPNTANVVYRNQDTNVALVAGPQNAIAQGATFSVVAEPADGFYFPHNFDADWNFTRPNA